MAADLPTFLFIPIAILGLGVIIFVHELGHHLVAKLFGVRVLTFSLGFGKRLWGFEHAGTDYRVSAVPLGGYVRMGGELPEDYTGDPGDFMSKPRWQRILVYLAGPAMNGIFSVALIAALFMVGVPMQAMQELPAVVGHVEEESPAARAGLERGDRILSLDGEPMEYWKDVDFVFQTSPERPVAIEYERDGETLSTTLVPDRMPVYELGESGAWPQVTLRIARVLPDTPARAAGLRSGDVPRALDAQPVAGSQDFVSYIEERAGQSIEMVVERDGEPVSLTVIPEDVEGKGRIGVQISAFRRLPLGEALLASVDFNVEIVTKSVQIIGMIFTQRVSVKSSVSGPIEIVNISTRAAQQGVDYLLYVLAFLSTAIGFMNLLPIPLLDGGHISILLVESAMRRDLSEIIKMRLAQFGFVMLMMLMTMVILLDLSKNLPGLFSGS